MLMPVKTMRQMRHLISKRNATNLPIYAKKTQMKDEWRLLKRKRKRLRQLRDEIRELSNQLHSKRVFYKGIYLSLA
ncbi:unnamed protein product [Dracunculus medinensis]|uniref:Transposase n=1 Tax=Dracunculus medinensis TaxID=318479 RepID=A0A0N4UFP8_DRAME|nr:unnamed protein product [Dracunculus medinensis]